MIMGDDIFLAPEITMTEEPGQIRINQGGNVAVEIDDEEPQFGSGVNTDGLPFGAGEIPPEISITKVSRSSQQGAINGNGINSLANEQNLSKNMSPYLKVRSDLGMPSNIRPLGDAASRPTRPPPLLRVGGLPPMPRLRFGGPTRPVRSTNPLAGMINMMPPGSQNVPRLPAPMPQMPFHPMNSPGMIHSDKIGLPRGSMPFSQPGIQPRFPNRNRNNQARRTSGSPVPNLARQQRIHQSRNNGTSPFSVQPSNGVSPPHSNTQQAQACRMSNSPLSHAQQQQLSQLKHLLPSSNINKISSTPSPQASKPKGLPPFINPSGRPRMPQQPTSTGGNGMPPMIKVHNRKFSGSNEKVQNIPAKFGLKTEKSRTPPPNISVTPVQVHSSNDASKTSESNSLVKPKPRRLSSLGEDSTLQKDLFSELKNVSSANQQIFPELNITVKTVAKKPQTKPIGERKLSQVDDLEREIEEELEELDDVEPEPAVEPITVTSNRGYRLSLDNAVIASTQAVAQQQQDKQSISKLNGTHQLPDTSTILKSFQRNSQSISNTHSGLKLIKRKNSFTKTIKVSPTKTINSQLPPQVRQRKVETLQFVRRADGKGFVRKGSAQHVAQLQGGFKAGTSLLKSKNFSKQKKKKRFRGGNYRFDGSSIKKRKGVKKRTQENEGGEMENGGESALQHGREPAVLAYLGIQRKDSTDSNKDSERASIADSSESISNISIRSQGPKAKKSFRPREENEYHNKRLSIDDITANDSLNFVRKRKVGVHESGMAFLKKIKVDSNDISNDGSQERMSFDLKTNHDDESNGPEPFVPIKENGFLDEKYIAQFATQNLGARRAKQQAQEAASKIIRDESGNLSSRKSSIEKSDNLAPLKCVCECANDDISTLPKKMAPTQYCQAIETVGVSRVGCRNKVTDFHTRRSGTNLPRQLYCNIHIERLKNHQACAFCGEFCSHGMFLLCRPHGKAEPHLFHRSCYNQSEKKMCPHCESTEKPITIQLKLEMSRMPLKLLQSVSKMGFYKSKSKNACELIFKKENPVAYKMSNGKVISSEGLPAGIEDHVLAKVIDAMEDKDKLKHVGRNMYIPTKAGDNIKLLQMLSLGYSPNQKFAEAENGNPLHVAAAEGHVLTTHILVQAGATLDVLDDEQNTALMIASQEGKSDIVRYLLQAGADLTWKGDDGMTSLHLAAQNGHIEVVHAILNQNNMPRKYINIPDEGGWTPLVWACENRHEEIINYLLKRGADPLKIDAEGNIALHWASLSGSRTTCETLLNHGCDVNLTNNLGETPMHIALRQDHYEVAVLLLMRGANLKIKNKNGQEPVEVMPPKKDLRCRTIVKLSTLLQGLMKDTKQHFHERILTNDLSSGKETHPIQCVNDLDDEELPDNFTYVSKNCFTTSVPIDRNISQLQHCRCTDNCSSEDSCNCSDLSVKSWYDLEGKLKEDFDYKEPPMIFECNDMCRCNVNTCHNRVLQHGITVRLQAFRVYGMGWGIRSIQNIPKGTFICEYVGEIISDSEAETREDSYLFDLEARDGDTFCIDANRYRNIAGLINHLCTPNLTPVKVFTNHQDIRFPHIAFFANRDIKKGEELGFDYGEKFWVIKHKYFTCHCASEKCRYNKSNILSFVREYYKRAGEPVPSDSPASSGRQSPQNSNSAKANTLCKNSTDCKVEEVSKDKIEPLEKEDNKTLDTKETCDPDSDTTNIDKSETNKEPDLEESTAEEPVVEEKRSPTLTIKLPNPTKENGEESELVSEILGGKKPTVVLEKELPKSPKGDGKSSLTKLDSSLSQDDSSTPINNRRPKRLVRKVVEDKDKKGNEKEKSK